MLSINFAVYINIELKVYTVLHSVKIAVIVDRFYVTIYFSFFFGVAKVTTPMVFYDDTSLIAR